MVKDCFVLLQIRACFQADRTFCVSHTVNIASLYLCRSLFYCSQQEIQHSFHTVTSIVGYWSHSDSLWPVCRISLLTQCVFLFHPFSPFHSPSPLSIAIFVFLAHAVAGIPLLLVTANRPRWWCHYWLEHVLPSPRLPVQPGENGPSLHRHNETFFPTPISILRAKRVQTARRTEVSRLGRSIPQSYFQPCCWVVMFLQPQYCVLSIKQLSNGFDLWLGHREKRHS